MEELKPNEQRAKTAMTLVWVVMSVDIISLISGYFQYDLLQNALHGTEISQESANANDLREQAIGIINLIAFIISAITFIQWFRRAYFNLHLKVKHLRFPEGWAAGSWFVPIMSLFRPYQIMKELFTETDDLLQKKLPGFQKTLSTSVIGWWWALWIINNFIGQAIFRYSRNVETLSDLISATELSMLHDIVGIPLALITVSLIKKYSAVEPLLNEVKEEKTEETTAAL